MDDTAEVPMPPVPAFAERGPVPIPGDEDDTWDEEPSGALGNDTYQGRRRARRRATRPLVVTGLVALLVGALIVVPLALRSNPTGSTPAAVDPDTQPAVVVPVPTPTDDDGEISSTAGPGASATPTRTAVRTTTRPAPVAPPDPTIAATTPPPTPVPPFQTLTIEAEAGGNSVLGPAERSSYTGASGGQIVGFLGITQGQTGQGRLILTAVTVPTTGTYTVTFHYIANNNRTAHIIVNGTQAGPVAVPARSDCCGTGSLNVTLQAGTNTIEFTNPTSRCPAIDRVVITRP
jgi:hypothetical protein